MDIALPPWITALGQWSQSSEVTLRIGYGALLLLQLGMTSRQAKRFFVSEAHGGYMESSPLRDRLWTPRVAKGLVLIWLLAALSIATGVAVLPAALINVAFARYFYVQTRWSSILRGMGAPGHMNYWVACLTALLAIAHRIDGTGVLRIATIFAFRVDYAFIMFMAGVYKLSAGYAQGEGFERGLVNPWWGFWASILRKAPPRWIGFRVLNHLGWSAEVVCAVLFLIPSTGPWAGAFFAMSFLMIAASIRLTFLAEMVALCCVLYVYPGCTFDQWIGGGASVLPNSGPFETGLANVLAVTVLAYVGTLPFSYLGMSYNFYLKRRLPGPIQRLIDWWSRTAGLVLWRVFTSDVINFYCDIYFESAGGERHPYFTVRPWDGQSGWRYMHVGEFICLASIFTTLKYYPHDPKLFERRLLRYVNTLPTPTDSKVVFEYHAIRKGEKAFEFPVVAKFEVDPRTAIVVEHQIDPTHNLRSAAVASPVFAGNAPGSYAPR